MSLYIYIYIPNMEFKESFCSKRKFAHPWGPLARDANCPAARAPSASAAARLAVRLASERSEVKEGFQNGVSMSM